MDTGDLIRLYPYLYHIAEDGSWPSIQQHGLLSTRRLVGLFGLSEPQATQLVSEHRPESVPIAHPEHGTAVVRDQKPLRMGMLEKRLYDMTPSEWLQLLNSHVFFWLQEERMLRMLSAPPYRNRHHTVLVVDSASLISSHEQSIVLSRINSGATLFDPPMRGSETFRSIDQFPHPSRRKALKACSDVAELAVADGVADIDDHVIRVERRIATSDHVEVVEAR